MQTISSLSPRARWSRLGERSVAQPGSAPALALVPVLSSSGSFQGQFGIALAYLLVFSLGVLFSMGLFGLGLGLVQQRLQSASLRLFQYSQYVIASASILFGGFWLSQSL